VALEQKDQNRVILLALTEFFKKGAFKIEAVKRLIREVSETNLNVIDRTTVLFQELFEE
jgi:hypothetical protein